MIHSKEPMLVPQASAAQYIADLAIAELTEAPLLEDLADILFDNTLDNKDHNLDVNNATQAVCSWRMGSCRGHVNESAISSR